MGKNKSFIKIPSKSNKFKLYQFEYYLATIALNYNLEIEKEFKFDTLEGRRYRFDYCFPSIRLAVEIDGGVWMDKSGHSSGEGITKDIEKLNLAVLNRYVVLRFTYQQSTSYIKNVLETYLEKILNLQKKTEGNGNT